MKAQTSNSLSREELAQYLDQLLDVSHFKDYCPNGLQVEGYARIERVVGGVTASLALIEAAIKRNADAIIVHHGWFWRGEDGRITHFRKQRIQTLLAHDINLFAYHLPLDAHPQLGNNAQLAKRLGWIADGRFAEQDIGWIGHTADETSVGAIAEDLARILQRTPQVIGDPAQKVRRIAWCSGGAQGYFEEAITAGADLYVSGEISEPNVHLARESGKAYLSVGHHASERYGIMALLENLQQKFGLACEFVDIDNPV